MAQGCGASLPMKPSKFPILMALAVALLMPLSVSPAFAAKKAKTPVVSATDAKALKSNVGKNITVEGTVLSTEKGPKDGLRFINFSTAKTTGFTAALVPAVYAKFPNLDTMVGKNVRVTGTLENYKKKTTIKVSRATQIKELKSKAKTATKATPSKTPTPTAAKKKQAS